jgi:tRNA threonylcarbamoyladenosine biosynthesis protein TsaB
MANLLIIDSSTEACSVALSYDGIIFSRFELAPRRHAELLLPMVDSVIKEAEIELNQLDAIACCVGPGAFTGLRIAISVAQGLAYATDLPCIAVSSLEILAAEAFEKTDAQYCFSSIDARMQEVYFAIFERAKDNSPILTANEKVLPPLEIDLSDFGIAQQRDATLEHLISSRLVKAGTGWKAYQYSEAMNRLSSLPAEIVFPKASIALTIANRHFEDNKLLKPAFLQPLYLRNNVAKKKSEQK